MTKNRYWDYIPNDMYEQGGTVREWMNIWGWK